MSDIYTIINKAVGDHYETNSIEFKKCSSDCPSLYDSLSSFSNQSSGGCIILGIDEKHDFSPVPISDISLIIKKVQEQCLEMVPEVRASIEIIDYHHYNLICICVPGLPAVQRPCYRRKWGIYQGSFIRVGDGDVHMTDIEVHNYLNLKQQLSDDMTCCGTIADLDDRALQEFLFRVADTRPRLYSLGKETILKVLNITKDSNATLAGQLMFGLYPQEFLPCAVINATRSQGIEYASALSTGQRFIDNRRIDGNISSMLNDALSFVHRNTRLATIVDPVTAKRNDKPEYPDLAIRELLLNALLHRDYSRYTHGEAISLNIYSNRLEIISPGGIFGGYSLEEIETQNRRSLRNPVLISLAETMCIVENRGTGISVTARAMTEADLPTPVYEVSHSHFKVTLFNSNADKTNYFS